MLSRESGWRGEWVCVGGGVMSEVGMGRGSGDGDGGGSGYL